MKCFYKHIDFFKDLFNFIFIPVQFYLVISYLSNKTQLKAIQTDKKLKHI